MTSLIILSEVVEVRSVAAAEKDQRLCLFEKARVLLFYLHQQVFTAIVLVVHQEMIRDVLNV